MVRMIICMAFLVVGCRDNPYVEKNSDVVSDKAAKSVVDKVAPRILGARDGVVQVPYVQETRRYWQKFVDGNYEITSTNDAVVLNFATVPVIYRWLTRIDDEVTAPSYSFKLADNDEAVDVKYGIGYSCMASEKNLKPVVKDSNGIYQIKITQSVADFDLSTGSDESTYGKTYCLSIWAFDQDGNAGHHQVEFIWRVIAPPVNVDVNASRYKAHHREGDVSWVGPPVWTLFRNTVPMSLKKDLVVAHAIIANPFLKPLNIKLTVKNAMQLTLNGRQFSISPKSIGIKYFAYDLSSDEVGHEKVINDGSIIINAHEVVVAQFILVTEVPLPGIANPDDSFWHSFAMEVGFTNLDDKSLVDGLILTTRDAGIGALTSEFSVPWGSDHGVRRRSTSRVGTP